MSLRKVRYCSNPRCRKVMGKYSKIYCRGCQAQFNREWARLTGEKRTKEKKKEGIPYEEALEGLD